MNQYVIDFDESFEKNQELNISQTPSEAERDISQTLNRAFDKRYGERVRAEGYQCVNFDVEIRNEILYVKNTFWVKENGEVEILKAGHKISMKRHSISSSIRKKVGNLAMSVHIPTPLLLFQKEIESSFKEAFLFKLGFTALFSSILILTGATVEQLLIGGTVFTVIAVLDAILGIIPGTVGEKDTSNDHKLQSKFIMYVVNMIAMVALLAVHVYLTNLVPDPSKLMYIPINVHIIGMLYLLSSYVYRIFKYIMTANNSKVPLPSFINKLNKKD